MIANQQSKKAIKYEKIKEKTKELLLTTTIHGIQNIAKSSHAPVKIIWFFCLMISSGYCAYLMSISFINFFEYDVITNINTIYEQQSEFPAVSFCSLYGPLNSTSILKCQFNLIDCSLYIETFNGSSLGKCFRFNSGTNKYNQKVDILKTKILSVTPLTINTHNISISIYNENKYNNGNSNYTIDNIIINQWFSNSNKGLAWQIKAITKISSTTYTYHCNNRIISNTCISNTNFIIVIIRLTT